MQCSYIGQPGRRMKVLIVSFYFAPYNCSGAVRVSKMAKYLSQFGHDVRVISAADQPFDTSLPLEIAEDRVIYTKWRDVNTPIYFFVGGRSKVKERGTALPSGRSKPFFKALGTLYKTFVHIPDGQRGWRKPAYKAACSLLESWRPDVIFASQPPATSLVVASKLSRKYGIPWVADFRDLWSDPEYYGYLRIRRPLDRLLEKRTLSSVAGITATSKMFADRLSRRHSKPSAEILNGYDLDPELEAYRPEPLSPGELIITYTGREPYGRRDPTPLFKAIGLLGEDGRRIRVRFYGPGLDWMAEAAKRIGVGDRVEIMGSVPQKEALRAQREADVLLLLQWNDPGEAGVYSGKIFEYLGARRTILSVGYTDGVVAELIRERGAGKVLDNPEEIAAILREWLGVKMRHGRLPELPESSRAGLSRMEQTLKLERFITDEILPWSESTSG
jgi:glycosyltransferase involved in cell wall biosynthesis